MLRISGIAVVCLLLALAGSAHAADCGTVEGAYVLNLSGFGGGSPYFYPIALIGNITVDKEGAIEGNYKIHAPIAAGIQANRNITGEISVKKCVGTLKVNQNDRLIHTFTVIVDKQGNFALATGETGLVVSGTASK